MAGAQKAHALRTDVVLVCPHLGDGGTQRIVSVLATAWSQRGRRVCVVTLYNEPDFYGLPAGVLRVRLGVRAAPWFPRIHRRRARAVRADRPTLSFSQRISRRLWTLASAIGRPAAERLSTLGLDRVLEVMLWTYLPTAFRIVGLRRLVRELGPSVVAAFGGVTNVMTVIACRGTGRRVLISERNDPDRQVLPTPWNQLRPRIYGEADLVTANTLGSVARLRAWVRPEKLRFVPNPLVIPQHALTGEPPRDLGRPCMLIVGRLCEQKAHDILLGAIALLPAGLHHWRLAVVGQGENEADVRRLAERLGVGDRVDWYGQVENPYAFYQVADLFVLPSRHEGMPSALLEAMSFGLPPIVSDASPGPLEVVRHGDTGLVVPVGDRRALAEAIALLANRPDLRRRLGENARREVVRYDLDTALAAWHEVFGWSGPSASDDRPQQELR